MGITDKHSRILFFYLAGITLISVALIALNALLQLNIPFTVNFLIAYVSALFVFVAWHALITKGWRRSLLMLCLSYGIAFTAEALGVNYGLIFGRYHYTDFLGLSLFGVPFLAALAWEPILYAAFSITDLLIHFQAARQGSRLKRLASFSGMAVIGSLATTAWDMMIDPIAVDGGWWVWHDGGPYVPYVQSGVPIQNFLGWLGVAFCINLVYRLVNGTTPQPQSSPHLFLHGPLMLYTSLFLTAGGVSITVLGRPEVGLTGLLAMGPYIAIAMNTLNTHFSPQRTRRALRLQR